MQGKRQRSDEPSVWVTLIYVTGALSVGVIVLLITVLMALRSARSLATLPDDPPDQSTQSATTTAEKGQR